MTNLDEDSFDMLYKNDCAAIPHSIWTTNVPYERKINMLSFTDNNFMICLFDFERFSIESRFPFFLSFFLHCIMEGGGQGGLKKVITLSCISYISLHIGSRTLPCPPSHIRAIMSWKIFFQPEYTFAVQLQWCCYAQKYHSSAMHYYNTKPWVPNIHT